jgi:aspartyl protease family protein
VDTGATDTTLDRSAAERVGINLAQLRFTLQVHTANGVVPGAKTRIATLRVGPFSLNDVPVTVIDADMDGDPMLGMAFLRKYKLSIGNDQLTISE